MTAENIGQAGVDGVSAVHVGEAREALGDAKAYHSRHDVLSLNRSVLGIGHVLLAIQQELTAARAEQREQAEALNSGMTGAAEAVGALTSAVNARGDDVARELERLVQTVDALAGLRSDLAGIAQAVNDLTAAVEQARPVAGGRRWWHRLVFWRESAATKDEPAALGRGLIA